VPATIQNDEPRKPGHPLEKWCEARLLPRILDVGHPAWDENQINLSFAGNLIGDAHSSALRVSRFRLHCHNRIRMRRE
jgi:hypothetical protein